MWQSAFSLQTRVSLTLWLRRCYDGCCCRFPARLDGEQCGAHGLRRGGAATVVKRCSDLACIVLVQILFALAATAVMVVALLLLQNYHGAGVTTAAVLSWLVLALMVVAVSRPNTSYDILLNFFAFLVMCLEQPLSRYHIGSLA